VNSLLPWIEKTVPLADKTVLEYGCGSGPVSCAVGSRAKRLIGLDISGEAVAKGRTEVARLGLRNVELVAHPVDEIFDALGARKGEIDVLLLYAVLEHMTVTERLTLLRLAREVVPEGGAIVVCETPNRLTYFDHHTAQMPFFHLLPDELALDYYDRSDRPDFTAAMDEAATQGRQPALNTLARWGRGVSFHEFEVVFGDLSKHVIASSHDVALFGERPVLPEEVTLLRFLQRVRPDLDGSWARSWLDVILSPTQVQHRPPVLRPWIAGTMSGSGVSWLPEEVLWMIGKNPELRIILPQATSTIVLGTATSDGHTAHLSLVPDGGEPVSLEHELEPWVTGVTTIQLAEPAQQLTLLSDVSCQVSFVCYEVG
jgi:SAM-dependent methyltransferase